jgi:hypothetical protein
VNIPYAPSPRALPVDRLLAFFRGVHSSLASPTSPLILQATLRFHSLAWQRPLDSAHGVRADSTAPHRSPVHGKHHESVSRAPAGRQQGATCPRVAGSVCAGIACACHTCWARSGASWVATRWASRCTRESLVMLHLPTYAVALILQLGHRRRVLQVGKDSWICGPTTPSCTNRSTFAAVLGREFVAVLQSSHRDLSIDTLSTFSTPRVLRLHADARTPVRGDGPKK